MRKMLVTVLTVLVLAVTTFGWTYVGGGILKEMGNSPNVQGLYFEGRITAGGRGLSVDLDTLIPQPSEEEMASLVMLLPYLNLNIPISSVDIYAGISPTLAFYNGQFLSSVLKEMGYVHAGLALRMNPIRIYAEAVTYVVYSPFQLGKDFGIGVGAQIGF